MKKIEKLKDIKVKTYLEYQEYYKKLDLEKPDAKTLLKTVQIFYELTDDDVSLLPMNRILDLNKKLEQIFSKSEDLHTFINVNGKKYGIEPKFDDMSFGEWIDLNTEDIVKQIAILYRPLKRKIFKKYTIEKYKADIEHYDWLKENLTCDIYFGFVGFFLKISQELLSYTMKSLEEDQDLTPAQKKVLQKSGHGFLG